MKKKSIDDEGHSPEEMRVIMRAYIGKSAERLRKRLREEWKRQTAKGRRLRHEIAV